MTEVVELLVRPAADAFLQVGVYVAVLLALVGVVRWRTGGRLEAALAERTRLAPLVGALLGVTPGCGGAIVVMPLYRRGSVSFGTVVAALVATMGDSSFVLLASAPRTALLVHAILLATGVVAGYLVDAYGIAPNRQRAAPSATSRPSTVGAAAAPTDLTGRLAVVFPTPSLVGFWLLAAAGLVVSVPVVFRLTDGLDVPYLMVGATGALASVGVHLASRRRTRCGQPDSLREALFDGARETAFVTVWVTVAFAGWTWLVAATGLDAGSLPALGLVGVAAGALLGLIPGCGPQIVLTGLYATGAVPLATLVANALSQDGDALFPLLASDRRSAIVATVLTTLPALAVGAVVHAVTT